MDNKIITAFFLSTNPPTVTAQEHKIRFQNGKPVFYDPPEIKSAKSKLMGLLVQHKPDQIIEDPIELVVTWCFPADQNHRHGSYRTTKPDTDNLNKMLKDCMTKVGFWKDDALVVREIIEKFWSDKPGIYIRVTRLTEGECDE